VLIVMALLPVASFQFGVTLLAHLGCSSLECLNL
jgi:hypothetical protein